MGFREILSVTLKKQGERERSSGNNTDDNKNAAYYVTLYDIIASSIALSSSTLYLNLLNLHKTEPA